MKRRLSESVIRYKLYEAALETGITTTQYHDLMSEAGILGWMKDALTNISAGKELAGDLKKMFSDKKIQVVYEKATEEIQKSVAELFKAGAEAGVDKDKLKDWLIAGINKMTETAADSAPAADEKAKDAGEGKPGEPVSPAKPDSAVPAIAAAAAEISGRDPEKAKDEAEKKNVDIQAALEAIASVIAQVTKVDKAPEIVDYLFKNNKILFEGRRRLYASDMSVISRLVFEHFEGQIMSERWAHLAKIVVEAPAAGAGSSDNEKGKDAKENTDSPEAKKFESLIDELVGKFKGVKKPQILDVLKALDNTKRLKVATK